MPAKKTEPSQRGAEQFERKPSEKGRDRWVCHVPPSQMTGVFERCQFVAMKAVSASRDDVDDYCCCGEIEEDGETVRPHRTRADLWLGNAGNWINGLAGHVHRSMITKRWTKSRVRYASPLRPLPNRAVISCEPSWEPIVRAMISRWDYRTAERQWTSNGDLGNSPKHLLVKSVQPTTISRRHEYQSRTMGILHS